MIAGMSPEDGESWPRYAAAFDDFLTNALAGFFISPANTLADMMRIGLKAPGLLKHLPLFVSSYRDVIQKYFKDYKVRESMAYQAFYCGLPPGLAPGLFGMFPYSEHRGIQYPHGGMAEVPGAFARCGKKKGMKVELKRRVERVLVSGGRVQGVRLTDGTEITSPVVVSNINARTLYFDLVGEEHLHPLARIGLKSYELSISAPVLYLGVDYEPPLDAHHTLLTVPMERLDDYWWNEYKKGLVPDDLFGLVCWPTMSDTSLAPEGHHVLNIILSGPYRRSSGDWDAEKMPYAERAIEQLSKSAIPGLADHVTALEVASPLDFERRLLMPEGGFLGLEMNALSSAVFRPSGKSKSVEGLYLAGSSTHPGGGVPTTVASGLIAADLVDRYEH